jgi:acyl-ACP thioesterase
MTKSIEIRALEALINQLDQTIARIDKEVVAKYEDTAIERHRTSQLIAEFQMAFPDQARTIVRRADMQLKLTGDAECDLLQYYDATYEE